MNIFVLTYVVSCHLTFLSRFIGFDTKRLKRIESKEKAEKNANNKNKRGHQSTPRDIIAGVNPMKGILSFLKTLNVFYTN